MRDSDVTLVGEWLTKCLGRSTITVLRTLDISRGSGCQVWDCEIVTAEGPGSVVLKTYVAGFDDYSRVGPVDTARKHALALDELPRFGVPTPRCLGFAAEEDEAAIVMESLAVQPFTPTHRVEAAHTLARLHMVHLPDLSPELADLISRSTPNRGRIGEAPSEPPLREIMLQHGDYFSVNIAVTAEGVRVLDWDLVALGDPMWDLGFLLEADPNLGEREAEEAFHAYQSLRPVDEARLRWQRDCWRAFWAVWDRRRHCCYAPGLPAVWSLAVDKMSLECYR